MNLIFLTVHLLSFDIFCQKFMIFDNILSEIQKIEGKHELTFTARSVSEFKSLSCSLCGFLITIQVIKMIQIITELGLEKLRIKGKDIEFGYHSSNANFLHQYFAD